VLFAETAGDLQDMINCLGAFCSANLLTVNAGKSEVVVFNSAAAGADRQAELQYHWVLNGASLTHSDHFTYLGIVFQDGQPMGFKPKNSDTCHPAALRGVARGSAALFALMSRCRALGLNNVAIQCHLFNALVLPVMSYGCEVWGAWEFSKFAQSSKYNFGESGKPECEQLQLHALRQSVGVPKSTPIAPLMHETRRRPVIHMWANQLINFWNKIIARSPLDVARMALLENVRLAVQQQGGNDKRVWAWAFLQGVKALDLPVYNNIRNGTSYALNAKHLSQTIYSKWQDKSWAKLHAVRMPATVPQHNRVRGCPIDNRDGFKLLTYHCWMRHADQVVLKGHNWTYHVRHRSHIVALARLRLGCSWLNIQRLRQTGVARNARICPVCSMQAREDEAHIFECPAYQDLRTEFQDVVNTVDTVAPDLDTQVYAIMNKSNDAHAWQRLALFAYKSYKLRNHLLQPENINSESDQDD
jgi:hypothetical protein